MRTLSFLAFGFLLAACPDLPEGRFVCSQDSDCPSSWRCNLADQRCYSRLPDAAVSDAGDGATSTDAGDGSVEDASDAGDGSVVFVPPQPTNCMTQNDVGTRSFAVETFQIPTYAQGAEPPTVGFNIDSLVSTTNQDVPGCRKIDRPDGTDNVLTQIYGPDGLGDLLSMAGINLNVEFARAVADQTIDLDIVLSDWNMTATDACVVVTIQGTSNGSAITPLVGRAPLVNGFVDRVTFGSKLRVVPDFALSPDGGLGSCTMSCVEVPLPFVIQDARARLRFLPDMSALVVSGSPDNTNSTMLGGYIRYSGADADAFSPGLTNLFTTIKADLVPTVHGIFETFMDLQSAPMLTWCTSTGGTSVSADTHSAAFLVSGGISPP